MLPFRAVWCGRVFRMTCDQNHRAGPSVSIPWLLKTVQTGLASGPGVHEADVALPQAAQT
jgi:hypothetical protein